MANLRFLLHAALAAAACLWLNLAAAQTETTLGDVLTALHDSGIDVIYSTDLVTPTWPLKAPLESQQALDRAREALAPYGLILQSVSPNRFLVRRAPTPEPPPAPLAPLAEISVYASQYTLGSADVAEPKSISNTEIDQMPGDEANALRATRLLPGVASNGSTLTYIRGSSMQDVLVQFDGVPLSDPFHMKDFQNLLSAFDTSAIGRMDVYSSGYPVRYGTRSAAVIDITPPTTTPGTDFTLGASRQTDEISALGRATDWPLDWIVTLRTNTPREDDRPGNGQTFGVPQLTESIGRVRLHADPDTTFSVGWLLLDDRTALTTVPVEETSTAHYRNEYAWLALDRHWSDTVRSHTTLVVSDAGRSRAGQLQLSDLIDGHVSDNRSVASTALRTDWTYTPEPRWAIDYGAEYSDTSARLRYSRSEYFQEYIASGFDRPVDNSLNADLTPRETAYATWISVRHRWTALEVEIGARLDAEAYEDYAVSRQLSPRVNLRYDITTQWHVYGSWGHFSQAQTPGEWRVEEPQVTPDQSELAVQSALGLAYEVTHATRFSLDAYYKRWTHVMPYYDNTLETATLVPDLWPDRLLITPAASVNEGVEISAHHAFSTTLDGWATYARSRTVDDFPAPDRSIPRSWDQPDAVTTGLNWNGSQAALETVLGWHTGWPRTPFTFEPPTETTPAQFELAPRNSSRWGNFFTLDQRVSWAPSRMQSNFSLWAETLNTTNRRNLCCDRPLAANTALDTTLTQDDIYVHRSFDVGFLLRFHD